MKMTILMACAALTLSGCGGPANTSEASNNVAAAPVEAKPEATPAAAASAITKEFMAGKWADVKDGDCAMAQDFKADGTVDGFFESWRLEGNTLVVKVMGDTKTFPVKMIDAKHIDVDRGGKMFRLVRC